MKSMRNAMRLVSMLLITALVSAAGFLTFTVYSQGSRWTTTRFNTRLNTAKQRVAMGNITDRDGTLLATTNDDGERRYAPDKSLRRALSQTVGDQMSMSGSGVETFHAGTLLGISGSIIDRTWQFVTGSSARGDDIRLTVSADLIQYIAEQFPSKKHGAACVVNYKTGEILAMVSLPNYDPQLLANRKADPDGAGSAYLNRCLQGQYTPGSVFKIVTLASALETLGGVTERRYVDSGPKLFGDSKVSCFGGAVHGEMSLQKAFAQSCNVVFAGLGYEMGGPALVRKAEQMGFNVNFHFKDVLMYQSKIPEDLSEVGEVAWTGVGQGKLLVTPMHMALIAGAVANGGVMREPQLIKQVTGVGGIPRLRTVSNTYGRIMQQQTAATVAQYMKKAVESGTASASAIKGYTVCGKTGTAEVSNDKKVQTDAWYVGYVADEAAPYAIAVVVEAGGTGGGTAAPLAQKALKKAIGLGLTG